MHRQALRIGESAFGPYHQNTLLSVGNIAKALAATGDIEQAVQFQGRADAIIEKQFALNLMTGSERQKLAFVRGLSERTDRTLSLHLNLAPDDPDARALAALVLLQRKGRVQDAMTGVMASVRQHAAAGADLDLLDRLSATIAQIARLSLSVPPNLRPVERQEQLAELERAEGATGNDAQRSQRGISRADAAGHCGSSAGGAAHGRGADRVCGLPTLRSCRRTQR
jgi:hypothetical protein